MPTYNEYLDQFQEFGTVTEIRHPIVTLSGLPNARPDELIIFENGDHGQILALNENTCDLLTFTNQPLTIGAPATRTGKRLSINLSADLIGQVINPLGDVIDDSVGTNQSTEERLVDSPPPSIAHRHQITQSLTTGMSLVDLVLPLGQGQRELIVGDQKTGKTTFALSVCKNQADTETIVIYAAIGKTQVEIQRLARFFRQEDLSSRAVIIASSGADPLGLTFIAPFTAMTVAEYFRDQGEDVLLVLDDLTAHAHTHREISLLARRFPGRDSYPGDIFHVHGRLLERAGSFRATGAGLPINVVVKAKEGRASSSITCLPIAVTQQNDLSDYIVSNLIGITDGHLLFDTTEFAQGHRPAINVNLSVTRVGKQTQSHLLQEVNLKLMSLMTELERTQGFSHLAKELTSEVREKLNYGEYLYSFFNQPPDVRLPTNVQLVFFSMIWLKFFSGDPVTIHYYRDNLLRQYRDQTDVRELVDQITATQSFDQLLKHTEAAKSKLMELCQATNKPTKK